MSIEDKYLKEYGETYSHIKEKNVRDTADKVLKSLRDVIIKEADKYSPDDYEVQKRFMDEVKVTLIRMIKNWKYFEGI
jgi:uncharacterized protein (DUF342 family)